MKDIARMIWVAIQGAFQHVVLIDTGLRRCQLSLVLPVCEDRQHGRSVNIDLNSNIIQMVIDFCGGLVPTCFWYSDYCNSSVQRVLGCLAVEFNA